MAAFYEADQGISGLAKGVAEAGAVVGAALVGAAVVSAKWAAEFQRDLTMIHTQAGDTHADLSQMARDLEAMAPAVGFGPDALAQAMYHVESAGFRGKQALDMVRQAAELAQIGSANLEDTTQAVVGSLAAFGDQGLTANHAVAILNATVGAGDMRMQGLASAMATGILPAARTVGISLTDVGAALATLTDNVTPPEEAATRLRMTFTMLAAGTPAANRALERIGLTSNTLGEDMRKPNGLLVAVQDLKTHLEKSGLSAVEQSDVIARAFGGGRSSAAIETLLSEFDRFKDKYKAINDGAHNFAAAWAETQQTTSYEWKDMQAEVQTLGVVAGSALLPLGNSLLKAVLPSLQQFGIWMQGPGVRGINTLGQGAGHVGNAIGIMVSGLRAGNNPGTVLMDTMQELGVSFEKTAPLAGLITDVMNTFRPILGDARKAVGEFMKEHRKDFQEIFATTKQIMGEIAPLIQAVLQLIQHFWHDHGQQVMSIVKAAMWLVMAIIKDALSIIRDVISLVTHLIRGDWTGVWHDVVKILGDAIGLIWDALTGLLGLIKNVLGLVLPMTWDLGKGIIQGIITGLWNGAGALFSEIGNIAHGALDAAKHALGISSPSKRAADELGLPFAQGWAGGIRTNSHLLRGAVQSASDALFGGSSAASGSLALAGSGGGGGGVVIDLRGSQLMSDRDIEILAQKLMPAIGRLAVHSGIKFRN